MLVALATAGRTTPVNAGNVSRVPPPAIEFSAPAKNADKQRKVYVQAGSGISVFRRFIDIDFSAFPLERGGTRRI